MTKQVITGRDVLHGVGVGVGNNEQGNGLLDAETAVLDGSSDSAPAVPWVNPNDSDTVSGSAASGVDEVRSKRSGTEVVVTAPDADGASGTGSLSI